MSGMYYYECSRAYSAGYFKWLKSVRLKHYCERGERSHKQRRLFAAVARKHSGPRFKKSISQLEFEKRTGQQGWIIGVRRA